MNMNECIQLWRENTPDADFDYDPDMGDLVDVASYGALPEECSCDSNSHELCPICSRLANDEIPFEFN